MSCTRPARNTQPEPPNLDTVGDGGRAAVSPRGLRPTEVARLLRVSVDKVRRWIREGRLRAFNQADAGEEPRWVVLPDHLAEFISHRQNATPAAPPPKRAKRRPKMPGWVSYYAD
jgi:hypothetical protein